MARDCQACQHLTAFADNKDTRRVYHHTWFLVRKTADVKPPELCSVALKQFCTVM